MILDHVFRLNPVFKLTPFEKLDSNLQQRFKKLVNQKDFYGILHAPREAKLSIKTVNRDLAALLRQLDEPNRLGEVAARLGKGTQEIPESFIIRLVLDSVLEVQAGDEFISGVEAVNRVLSSAPRFTPQRGTDDENNLTQILSKRALHFAFGSALTHSRDLAFLLYNFNRIPLSRRWRRRLPDERAVAEYLDLAADDSWPGMPSQVEALPIRLDGDGQPDVFDLYWRRWSFGKRNPTPDRPSYKVYFSPHPRGLPHVFRIVRDTAAASDAHAMKMGRSLSGILRADKFIVYFSTYLSAFDFARQMAKTLVAVDGQGTPFSFQVDPKNPVVSMGVDPPRGLSETYSWRLYIATKLSLAIQGAQRSRAEDLMEYIHTYMRMIGVDSFKWSPVRHDWSMEFHLEERDDEQSPQKPESR